MKRFLAVMVALALFAQPVHALQQYQRIVRPTANLAASASAVVTLPIYAQGAFQVTFHIKAATADADVASVMKVQVSNNQTAWQDAGTPTSTYMTPTAGLAATALNNGQVLLVWCRSSINQPCLYPWRWARIYIDNGAAQIDSLRITAFTQYLDEGPRVVDGGLPTNP